MAETSPERSANEWVRTKCVENIVVDLCSLRGGNIREIHLCRVRVGLRTVRVRWHCKRLRPHRHGQRCKRPRDKYHGHRRADSPDWSPERRVPHISILRCGSPRGRERQHGHRASVSGSLSNIKRVTAFLPNPHLLFEIDAEVLQMDVGATSVEDSAGAASCSILPESTAASWDGHTSSP